MKKHRIDWSDVITILIAVMALAVIVSIAWAVIASLQTETKINTAKIRYFDGSTDTLQITRYSISDETVTVWTRSVRYSLPERSPVLRRSVHAS